MAPKGFIGSRQTSIRESRCPRTHQIAMLNARKKIVKEKGAAPTDLEEEVAKALFDIEVLS